MLQIENDCTRFLNDVKAITNSRWDMKVKQLQGLRECMKPKMKKPVPIDLEVMEDD